MATDSDLFQPGADGKTRMSKEFYETHAEYFTDFRDAVKWAVLDEADRQKARDIVREYVLGNTRLWADEYKVFEKQWGIDPYYLFWHVIAELLGKDREPPGA